MKLENRYIVFKRSDIDKYIDLNGKIILASITQAVANNRRDEKRPPLKGVFIESDWPEYEPTFIALENRVDAEKAAQKDNRHYCNYGYWWEIGSPNGTAYCVSVGIGNVLLETETFANRGAAYNQKNKWLTKHNMFCVED